MKKIKKDVYLTNAFIYIKKLGAVSSVISSKLIWLNFAWSNELFQLTPIFPSEKLISFLLLKEYVTE